MTLRRLTDNQREAVRRAYPRPIRGEESVVDWRFDLVQRILIVAGYGTAPVASTPEILAAEGVWGEPETELMPSDIEVGLL